MCCAHQLLPRHAAVGDDRHRAQAVDDGVVGCDGSVPFCQRLRLAHQPAAGGDHARVGAAEVLARAVRDGPALVLLDRHVLDAHALDAGED